MKCGEIPVVQNASYSTHSVRRPLIERAAEAGAYEAVDVLPYQLYSSAHPTSSL